MSNTNQRFVQDINRLIAERKLRQSELPKVTVEPIAAVRGVGDATALPVSQSEGIASPLKEVLGTRVYYEPEVVTSSDGLFVFERKEIRKITFLDSNGEPVVLEFLKQ